MTIAARRIVTLASVVLVLFFWAGCAQGHDDDHAEHEGHNHAEEADEHEGHGHDQEAGEHEDHDGEVIDLSAEAVEIIGLEIGSVEMRKIQKEISLNGEVARDFEQVFHVTAGKSGVVSNFFVRLGDEVENGTALAEVKPDDGSASFTLTAPGGCEVVAVNVSRGERVDAITSILTVAYLHELKANFDVYEKDLSMVKRGQRLLITTDAYPGKQHRGTVIYISPRVEEHSRTVKIRARVDNHEHTLKLGMFVTGRLSISSQEKSLVVLNDAVLQLDERRIVFVPLASGEYGVREVVLGQRGNDYSQITSGLKVGDSYVTRGAFELKAELVTGSLSGHAGHGH